MSSTTEEEVAMRKYTIEGREQEGGQKGGHQGGQGGRQPGKDDDRKEERQK